MKLKLKKLSHFSFTEMATITACTTTSLVARAALVQNGFVSRPSSLLGLPAMSKYMGKVKCSMERKEEGQDGNESKLGMGASLMAAACAATMSSPAAMALVDERMSTEGTGLPFGLSNNLLGWILLGVFGLIWSLYTVYTSSLDEDEDSGLSL
ncbi:PREDICTED: photosystem II reaction center W protein, chloroplastic-like [Nicotiana attenuata]|uniref:PSII 6.1 kDa protein n=1 Tax=Nicotiana attenuata TaxID=49451 RepID=A0A314LFT6_NICAT|nr:PREDICTED: photosystem II reaction center W protein, chloroplastic-like [Nicotiana attenuata]OIT40555.1 photosystem ii reaction center w protein, chloroplastic [Nicotiana attenuata]